jgi:hypothetical protein
MALLVVIFANISFVARFANNEPANMFMLIITYVHVLKINI